MPSPYANWKKDGLKKLISLARVMCSLVNNFAHIIESKYSSNTAILALLTAAKALCAALPEAMIEFDAIGYEDSPPPLDPSMLAGINEGASAPPDIETDE
jgi:hypothetical protein